MGICLERGADLNMAQLMPLPLTVSCFSKIQIGFAFLVAAHPGSPGQTAVKRMCVCVCVSRHSCQALQSATRMDTHTHTHTHTHRQTDRQRGTELAILTGGMRRRRHSRGP